MKLALFIPCYIDQFYPEVGKASLSLLSKLGYNVEVPAGSNCCGQPIANAGFEKEAQGLYLDFVETYARYDCIIIPSGSCTLHICEHYDTLTQNIAVERVRANTYDICDFLLQFCMDKLPDISFPHKINLHTGCHSLRGLGAGHPSELHGEQSSSLEDLLKNVNDYDITPTNRPDECCGFGGTFSIMEEAVSVKMGEDKIDDISQGNPDFLVGNDMSCLMHLDGVLRRKDSPVQVKHIIEILDAAL